MLVVYPMTDKVIEIHDSFSVPLFVVKLNGLTDELNLKDKLEKEFVEKGGKWIIYFPEIKIL